MQISAGPRINAGGKKGIWPLIRGHNGSGTGGSGEVLYARQRMIFEFRLHRCIIVDRRYVPTKFAQEDTGIMMCPDPYNKTMSHHAALQKVPSLLTLATISPGRIDGFKCIHNPIIIANEQFIVCCRGN